MAAVVPPPPPRPRTTVIFHLTSRSYNGPDMFVTKEITAGDTEPVMNPLFRALIADVCWMHFWASGGPNTFYSLEMPINQANWPVNENGVSIITTHRYYTNTSRVLWPPARQAAHVAGGGGRVLPISLFQPLQVA